MNLIKCATFDWLVFCARQFPFWTFFLVSWQLSSRFLLDFFGTPLPCHSLSSSSCIINQTVIFMKYLYITPSLLLEHLLLSAPEHFSLNMSQSMQTWCVQQSRSSHFTETGNICITLSVCGGVIPWQAYNASLIKHYMIGIPHIMYSFSWAGRWFMIS